MIAQSVDIAVCAASSQALVAAFSFLYAMFANIAKTIKPAPVQKATLQKVALQKAGWLSNPHMKTFLFKIDGDLHARFSKKAAHKGLNKSAAMHTLEWLEKD